MTGCSAPNYSGEIEPHQHKLKYRFYAELTFDIRWLQFSAIFVQNCSVCQMS